LPSGHKGTSKVIVSATSPGLSTRTLQTSAVDADEYHYDVVFLKKST
jgi:hypothetical protein